MSSWFGYCFFDETKQSLASWREAISDFEAFRQA